MYHDGGMSLLNLIRSLYSLDRVGQLIRACVSLRLGVRRARALL
jgi:hypothetical protein